jgi:hypothetical protein
LRLSLTIPSSQKIYLWKFIVAEVPVSKLSTLIDFCSKNYCAEYWSGVINYFRVHNMSITKEIISLCLVLPLHLCSIVAGVLSSISLYTVTII